MSHRAVIFDLGGVVLDSPLHAIAAFEQTHGIPLGHVNRVVVETGPPGAWSRLERGEIAMTTFFSEFDRECAAAGHPLSSEALMTAISSGGPRPLMLDAIRTLRAEGFQLAALTNNWSSEGGARRREMDELRALFHAFVESSVVGMRKPDPRIYEYTCRELSVEPGQSVFLDDIGRNLKAARALGMTTIKVESAEQALAELSGVLGLTLTD